MSNDQLTLSQTHGSAGSQPAVPPASSRLGWRAMASAASALRLAYAALREIFDESAYARFLARSHATPSRHSYREFQRELARRREHRPRCC